MQRQRENCHNQDLGAEEGEKFFNVYNIFFAVIDIFFKYVRYMVAQYRERFKATEFFSFAMVNFMYEDLLQQKTNKQK